MYNLNNGFVWQVKQPHEIFDETGLGTEALLVGLDRKLQELEGMHGKKEGRKFRAWLKEMQSDIFALVFHAGEIVFEQTELISMHVLCANDVLDQMSKSITDARLNIFRCSISDYIGLAEACTENGGSRIRAFFSSELLIAAKSPQEMKILDMHALSIKDIFEDGNVLSDIGMMVGYEISEKLHKNRNENAVDVDMKEFESMAKEAMKKRRVNPYMQEKVIPFVKKAISM